MGLVLEALHRAVSGWQVGFDGGAGWSRGAGCHLLGEV